MTFPLVIWGKFNWKEQRQLLKKVIYIYIYTYAYICILFYTNNKKKNPLRIGLLGKAAPSSLFVVDAGDFFRWCAAFHIPWKHSQSYAFEMEVQVQLSIEKGTGSNMLKLLRDISSPLTPCPQRSHVENTFQRTGKCMTVITWSVFASTFIF